MIRGPAQGGYRVRQWVALIPMIMTQQHRDAASASGKGNLENKEIFKIKLDYLWWLVFSLTWAKE